MKKKLLLTALVAVAVSTAQAGGLMTNTNYHIAFDRMMARGATTEIDAVFSNPAGLAWGHEGWQLSLNFQKPWQYRDIELTTQNGSHTYEGKASAPIVPALFASYKHDRWAISSMIGPSILHGPHQSALKSTKTGVLEFNTSSVKLSLFILIISIFFLLFHTKYYFI